MTPEDQAQHSSSEKPAAAATLWPDWEASAVAQKLFQVSPGFACILRGPEHVFEFANDGYFRLVGPRDLIGKPIREVFPQPELDAHVQLLDQVHRTGQPYVGRAVRLLVRPKPGSRPEECFLDLSYLPIITEDGKVSGILAQGYDVTALVRTQEALHTSEQRLQLALEAAGEGVWDWNIAEDRFTFSKRGREMLGYGTDEVGGRLEDWLGITHPEDRERVREETMACLRGKVPIVVQEYRVRNKQGDWQWIVARGAVVARNAEGRAMRMMGTTVDISNEQEALHRANFDTLTGLANRSLFRDRLDHEIALSRRSGQPMALFFIDLDRFKEVNDLLGHDAGDELLRQAAGRIRDCVRKSDMAARLGGDEFTVILTALETPAQVSRIAQKILHALALPFLLDGKEVTISASIGITLFPADAAETGHLVRNADQAMYAAKQAGRNQFRFFTPSMQEAATLRIALIAQLRQALPRHQLRVVFQPIMELSTERIVKAEALLRWQHPAQGLLAPAAFIPLAEESGLINEIGNWVFMQAAIWSRRWSDQTGSTFQVSINRSPAEFTAPALGPSWDAQLRELGLGWNSISVEITENLLLNTSHAVESRLLRLRESGIQVSIDDFGTGYSSLAYLKKFDVDFLKIDQSFVRETASCSNARVIAETIIVMAHKLGLKVVAEGVETAEQRDWLRAAGCDYAQGFFFSEPVPPERLGELLGTDPVTAH
ncbi:MAG TPA: EAL domain-containing protein [Noviherbaspirillum sp.]|jgi:diguanylate cyclase (GGDEF)-like protein/PAS domain S-box-containing protein|uniref:putative bifunctional diguanylate cyclase/phosphodiesterase n=1 Tax=Noviherbaspirillum sp. TaxID=1926288 RepID=UPI002F94B9DF